MYRRQLFLSGLVLLLILMPGLMASAQGSETLAIVEVDETTFPEIAVTLRYLDAQNKPVQDFTAFEVTIGEQAVPDTDINIEQVQRPIAVSLVVDLSAAMRGEGIPPKPRFKDMQSLLISLVQKLQLAAVKVSLVVFAQETRLYHPMTGDIVGVLNTINNADPERPFVPQEQGEEAAAGPYPLEEAVLEGLRQFDQVDAENPRVLFVFAAGTPEATIETETLRAALKEQSTEENPLTFAVLGFGSGEETEPPPANPALLEQLAQAGDGVWLHFHTSDVGQKPALNEAAEQLFEQAVRRVDHYLLRFQADVALAGNQLLQVRAGNAEDTEQVDIGAIPPRINVWTDSRDFQDRVELRITTEFAQSDLTKVEYLLDNRRIAEATNPPDFAYTLDVYSEAFQKNFAPGEHELVAAVTDANEQHARSSPLVVTVFAPPPPPETLMGKVEAMVADYWGLALIILGGVLALVIIVYGVRTVLARSKSTAPSALPGSSSSSGSSKSPSITHVDRYGRPVDLLSGVDPGRIRRGEDAIATYTSDDDKTQAFDDDKTQAFDDDKTQAFDAEAEEQHRFCVVVVQGQVNQETTRFDLRGKKRHYEIGRPSKDTRPEIPLANDNVSRNHAKLVMLKDGDVQLIAGNSRNGTFVGDEQKKLQEGEQVKLNPGDVFWISPALQLRLEEEKKP